MASNKNYNFTVDLSNIKKKKSRKETFDWKNSIGTIVTFKSDVLCGEITILEYFPKSSTSQSAYLKIGYENIVGKITTQCLKKGALSGFLREKLFKWEYEIGDLISDNRRNFEIIDKNMKEGNIIKLSAKDVDLIVGYIIL